MILSAKAKAVDKYLAQLKVDEPSLDLSAINLHGFDYDVEIMGGVDINYQYLYSDSFNVFNTSINYVVNPSYDFKEARKEKLERTLSQNIETAITLGFTIEKIREIYERAQIKYILDL